MSNELSIDVVVVTKNRQEKLFRALCALLANDILPKSIIVIDGSSQPFFYLDFIRTLSKVLKVKFIYKLDRRYGLSEQRNLGLVLAKNDIVVFVDDDEITPRNWIATIQRLFREDVQRMVVTGSRRAYYPDNFWNKIWLKILSYEQTKRGYRNFMFASNTAYKTTFLRKYKLTFEPRMKISSEDVYLAHRIIDTGQRIFADPDLYVYHDFRKDALGFYRQWFWYGYGTFEAHYYGMLHEKNGFKEVPIVLTELKRSTQWFYQLNNLNLNQLFCLCIRDCFFILGYAYSYMKSRHKS